MEFNHNPVLLEETIGNLDIKANGIYVDGTLGGAGHSLKILERLSSEGLLIGIDRDIDAIKPAEKRLNKFANVKYINDNHDNIKQILRELGIKAVDGILLDLGVSSYQIDEDERGFSYVRNSPLDMRMDKSQDWSAKDVVNSYSEERLAKIIYEYGEERFSRQIARRICEYRKDREITSTGKLAEIIEKSIPNSNGFKGGHPAKRTFQAIRIEVNNEIEPLYNTVKDSIDVLGKGGRLCIITFHSLEDRAVKNAYRDLSEGCTCPKDLPYCICGKKSARKNYHKKTNLADKRRNEK